MTRDTVIDEKPASAATSDMVGAPICARGDLMFIPVSKPR
jgi:hypothetical protein